MEEIAFSNTSLFRPILPEGSQVSPGSYGFELALWIAQKLSGRGIVTSYPFFNVEINPNGGADWFVEYIYKPEDFDWKHVKLSGLRVPILIGVGTEANEGDAYGENSLLGIRWHIVIAESPSAHQKSGGVELADVVEKLARFLSADLEATGIDLRS